MKSFEEIWFESGETQTTTDSAETILSPACLYSIYIGDIDFTSWGKGMPKVKGHPTMSHQRIPTNMPISNTNECSPNQNAKCHPNGGARPRVVECLVREQEPSQHSNGSFPQWIEWLQLVDLRKQRIQRQAARAHLDITSRYFKWLEFPEQAATVVCLSLIR